MTMPNTDLTEKIALITGCAGLLGPVHADALLRCGATVVVTDVDEEKGLQTANGLADQYGADRVMNLRMDVSDHAAVEGVRQQVLDIRGKIDVLINNAAIRPSSPFLEMDEDEWNRVLAVGMQAAFWLSRAALPGMIERGWGRILNFAGMNAIHGYNGRAHVSVAKHGVWGLTKALAKEFGPQGTVSYTHLTLPPILLV